MVDLYPSVKDRYAFVYPPVGYSPSNHREIPQLKNRFNIYTRRYFILLTRELGQIYGSDARVALVDAFLRDEVRRSLWRKESSCWLRHVCLGGSVRV